LTENVDTPGEGGRLALLVATGILFSRLTGLVRQRVFAHYFGLEPDADAFSAAFRIPNFLQNLFGEGALSASFIPVYAALVARGDRREADRVAGAVVSLLALLVSALVLVGVLTTPVLIGLIAPGFTGASAAACGPPRVGIGRRQRPAVRGAGAVGAEARAGSPPGC
jgi:putative peptidoglycan lipid II flippase